MSENLDLVRSIYAAWERGDFSSVDWADPEIEFVIPDLTPPGRWKGIAGMAGAWRDVLRAWKDFRAAAEGCGELDGERVLVLDVRSGRGKTSGMEIGDVGAEGAGLFHV